MNHIINSRQIFVALGMATLLFVLSGCGGGSGGIGSANTMPQTDAPTTMDPFHPNSPQVISGWLDEYSRHIEARVSRDYPYLLGLASSRMKTVCPNWDRLDRGTREKFWSSLLWSIAGPESGRNRTAVYRETTMSIDAVTGQQIRSEGLLQLSYVDVRNYGYPGGDVLWEHDRKMALDDYAQERKYGNPGRTILNAYSNLNLGLFIMNRLAQKYPSESLEKAYGRYWHTMRTTSNSFSKVLSGLKSKLPDCF